MTDADRIADLEKLARAAKSINDSPSFGEKVRRALAYEGDRAVAVSPDTLLWLCGLARPNAAKDNLLRRATSVADQALSHVTTDDEGVPLPANEVCYCTDTGTDWGDGVLRCLPCQLTALIAALTAALKRTK